MAFLGVEPAYLDAAIAAMVEAHGSIDGYLEQVLGVFFTVAGADSNLFALL